MNESQSLCDSKKKYTLLAVEYVTSKESGLCQSYYQCKVCGEYHIFTINKKVAQKRNKKFKIIEKETYQAIRNKKARKGFKKR